MKSTKKRLRDEGNELVTICNQLKIKSHKDGKMYKTDVADMKGIFRIIQSILSPKAEPFKMWISEVAKRERNKIRMKETIIYLLRHSEQYRDCYNFGDDQLENEKIILSIDG